MFWHVSALHQSNTCLCGLRFEIAGLWSWWDPRYLKKCDILLQFFYKNRRQKLPKKMGSNLEKFVIDGNIVLVDQNATV